MKAHDVDYIRDDAGKCWSGLSYQGGPSITIRAESLRRWCWSVEHGGRVRHGAAVTMAGAAGAAARAATALEV